jgi:hypothetical protein
LGVRGFVIRNTPNLGLECQHCGAKLRIVRTRLYIVQSILLALSFFGLRGLASLKSKGHLDAIEQLELLCLAIALVGGFVLLPLTPSLLRLRLVGPGEAVTFAAGTPKADDDAAPGWICPKCHEKNPENFEICWKCEHARRKAAAI